MLSFIAQYHSHHSADGAKQWRIRLDVDESHKAGIKPLHDATMGDTFLVLMLPVDEEFASFGEVVNETEDKTINRLRRQMHALIREVSKEKNLTVEEVKTSLKRMLKQKGLLTKSTSELGKSGFVVAVYLLQNEF